jgi:hypothetical protein
MRTCQHIVITLLERCDKMFVGHKSDAASASIFRLIWLSLLHNVVKRVRNKTARFRCVFVSTEVMEFERIG